MWLPEVAVSIDYVYGRTGQTGLLLVQSLTKGTQTVYLDYDATGTPQVFTTDTGVENFYVYDGSVGNVLGLVNAAGVVTATYSYDPYGDYNTTSSTGSAAGLNRFRTAGGLYDRTTAFLKYGQRWYNPTTGRFTQQDSIGRFADPAQGNRYPYAADNPTNNIDPTGRESSSCKNSYVGFTASAVGIIGLAVAAAPLTLRTSIGAAFTLIGGVWVCQELCGSGSA